jgi:hypothetical protein
VEPVLIAEPADRLGASSSQLSKVPKRGLRIVKSADRVWARRPPRTQSGL